MSKVYDRWAGSDDEYRENPEDKKFLSLTRDRRNVYGENAKSSRKNVARSKQRRNQAARSSVSQVLAGQTGPSELIDLDSTDEKVIDKEKGARHKRFKKWPDAPLCAALVESKTNVRPGSIPWELVKSRKFVDQLRQLLRDRFKS